MNFHAIFNIEILQIMKSILKQQMHNPNFYVPLVSFEKHKGIIFSNVHVTWWSSTITYVIIYHSSLMIYLLIGFHNLIWS